MLKGRIGLITALLVALTLLGLAARKADAAPLDEALSLVVNNSTAVMAARDNAVEMSNSTDWSARLKLAYQLEATNAESEGLNAGAYLEIPLFSNKSEIGEIKARYDAADTEYTLRKQFLGEVSKLVKLGTQLAEAEYMAGFFKDKLDYYKEAESQGLIEPKQLWTEAKPAQQAHFKAKQIQAELKTKIEEIARTYGNHQWKRLQALLVAHVKQNSQ